MGFLEEVFGNGSADTKKEEHKNDGYSLFGGIFVNDYDNEKYQREKNKEKIKEKTKEIEGKITRTNETLNNYRRNLKVCEENENSNGIRFYERNIKRLESEYERLYNEKRWLK